MKKSRLHIKICHKFKQFHVNRWCQNKQSREKWLFIVISSQLHVKKMFILKLDRRLDFYRTDVTMHFSHILTFSRRKSNKIHWWWIFVVSKASCKISELKHLKSHYSSKTVIYKSNYPKTTTIKSSNVWINGCNVK